MTSLKVQIVRFVDGHQPGFVECEFRDAKGELHVIRDKLPVLTTANLWSDSAYPQPGEIRCQVLDRISGSSGDQLVRVTLASPDGIETLDGRSEFLVAESQVGSLS